MLHTYEYRNTSGTHFKHYIIEVDSEARKVTTKWGRIGTELQTKTVPFGTVTGLNQYVEQVVAKRLEHGYWLYEESKTGSSKIAMRNEFLGDLEDLRDAEAIY